jgi:hypothetical protein
LCATLGISWGGGGGLWKCQVVEENIRRTSDGRKLERTNGGRRTVESTSCGRNTLKWINDRKRTMRGQWGRRGTLEITGDVRSTLVGIVVGENFRKNKSITVRSRQYTAYSEK